MSIRRLPIFKGYTVDFRLREFRKAEWDKEIEFLDMDSEEGDKLLGEWIEAEPEQFIGEVEHYLNIGVHVKVEYVLLAAFLKGELKKERAKNKREEPLPE